MKFTVTRLASDRVWGRREEAMLEIPAAWAYDMWDRAEHILYRLHMNGHGRQCPAVQMWHAICCKRRDYYFAAFKKRNELYDQLMATAYHYTVDTTNEEIY